MNVIRINWQFVRCLFLFLLIFYAFKVLLSFLLFTDYSTLSYDSGSQHFFIKSKVLTSSDGIFRESDRVPFQIKSATIHYTQIPEQLWLNVLEKASKLGLNTIEIIIPWGIHEPFPNQFDFSSKSNDLDTFINLVHHLNLHLLVRFDPFYQDSNYDFGGLPAWLLGYNFNSKLFDLLDLKEETFQHRYNEYLKTLLTIINRNQRWKNEGPIIGVVVQKIYGSNSKNSIIKFFNENYIKFIENQLYKYDIEEMLLSSRSVCEIGLNLTFCDPNIYIYQPAMLDNDLPLPKNFPVRKNYKNKLEIKRDLFDFRTNLINLLISRKSFSFKSFFSGIAYKPIKNSSTSKFFITRNGDSTNRYINAEQLLKENSLLFTFEDIYENRLIYKNLDTDYKDNTLMVELKMNRFLSFKKILDSLSPITPKKDKKEMFIESLSLQYNNDMSQAFYIVYNLKIILLKGTLILIKTKEINDYSIVICDLNEHIFTIEPKHRLESVIIIKLERQCDQIDIVVENQGRSSQLNIDSMIWNQQRKGILLTSTITFLQPNEKVEMTSTEWRIFSLDFKQKVYNKLYPNSNWLNDAEFTSKQGPFLAYSNFNVNKSVNYQKGKGIYLSMKNNWTKGVCILNGYILGQYSSSDNILFIPSFLLKETQNDLIVFEMVRSTKTSVYFQNTPILN